MSRSYQSRLLTKIISQGAPKPGFPSAGALGSKPGTVPGLLDSVLEQGEGLGRVLNQLIEATEAQRARDAVRALPAGYRHLVPAGLPSTLARFFPWLSAAMLAAMLWNIVRAKLKPVTQTKASSGGPAPGEDGHVPFGWRLLEEKELPSQWDTYSGPNSRWDDAFYATPNDWPLLGPDPALRRDWTAPPMGNGMRRFRMKQIAQNTNFHTPDSRWEWDAISEGSGSTTPGRDIAPKNDPMPWEEVIPSVAPQTVMPTDQPARVLPIPARMLERFNRASEKGETNREVGPRRMPRRLPRARGARLPRHNPIKNPDPSTETVIKTLPKMQPPGGGGGGTTTEQPSTHEYKRKPGREIKLKAPLTGLIRTLVNAATETADAVAAIHKALPPRCRRSRSWRDKNGKWHRALVSSMLRDISNCGNHLDWNAAARNLLVNFVQDALIGLVQGRANKATAALGGKSGQGYGTRISKSGDPDSAGNWADLITKPLEDFLKDLTGPTKQQPIFADRPNIPNLRPVKPHFKTTSQFKAFKPGKA